MDVFSPEKRSLVMSRIRSTGAKSTENTMRKLLEDALGPVSGESCPWKEHDPDLPGRPDFAFWNCQVAVFIDGCFWHGCPHCQDGHTPKSNTAYWAEKIRRNKQRDRRVASVLRRAGWSVIRVWECRLKANPEAELQRIIRKLRERTEKQ